MHSDTEGLYVCAVQPSLREPDETCIDAAVRVQKQMASILEDEKGNVDLFVLPELCPLGYTDDTLINYLPKNKEQRHIIQAVQDCMKQAAVELQVYICYGTIGMSQNDVDPNNQEEDISNNKFTIRQVVVDRQGEIIALYDKIYLCNYGVCAETRYFQPGKDLCSFTIHSKHDIDVSMRFGLILCADMRYPMLARALTASHGVDAILQPAAFARDVSFRTWTSFCETRAVENSVYWVAVNYAGPNFGNSSILPPWIDDEHEPKTLGTECSHLVEFLSHETIQQTRSTMPFHRTMQQEEAQGRQV